MFTFILFIANIFCFVVCMRMAYTAYHRTSTMTTEFWLLIAAAFVNLVAVLWVVIPLLLLL